jgi:DNA-binding NarL/FixJ family response regulator
MGDQRRRLVVVEDDALTASLLSESLESQGFEVQVASGVVEALAAVDRFDPDVALIDLALGEGPSGLDLAHVLHREHPWIALLLLTKHPDLRTAGISDEELPAGCGFLRKDRVRDTRHLLDGIEAVLADRPAAVRHDQDPAKPLGNLTSRQMEILRYIALGYTNDYIARRMETSRSSVERWVTEIFRRLGIDTQGDINPRVEAARRFIAVAALPERTPQQP